MANSGTGWLVWGDPLESVHLRVALAGDFLPPSEVDARAVWRDAAAHLDPIFNDVDITFANLETPVGIENLPAVPKPGLGANLHGPSASLDYLKEIRAYVVSTANNHIYDYGVAGELATRRALADSGLTAVGSGRSAAAPPAVHVWNGPSSLRIGFWAAANNTLTRSSPHTEGVEYATPKRAKEAVDTLLADGATTLIALIHAGLEHTDYPDPNDVQLVEDLASAGFDVIATCHSHRLSGYSRWEEGPRRAHCFHGLGSISSAVVYTERDRTGLVVVVGINERGQLVRVEAHPIVLDADGWGRIPGAEAREDLKRRFFGISAEIAAGTYRELFYRDMAPALLKAQAHDIAAAYRAEGLRGVWKKILRVRMKHVKRLLFKLRLLGNP